MTRARRPILNTDHVLKNIAPGNQATDFRLYGYDAESRRWVQIQESQMHWAIKKAMVTEAKAPITTADG